jgi:hypothetical protein
MGKGLSAARRSGSGRAVRAVVLPGSLEGVLVPEEE